MASPESAKNKCSVAAFKGIRCVLPLYTGVGTTSLQFPRAVRALGGPSKCQTNRHRAWQCLGRGCAVRWVETFEGAYSTHSFLLLIIRASFLAASSVKKQSTHKPLLSW